MFHGKCKAVTFSYDDAFHRTFVLLHFWTNTA